MGLAGGREIKMRLSAAVSIRLVNFKERRRLRREEEKRFHTSFPTRFCGVLRYLFCSMWYYKMAQGDMSDHGENSLQGSVMIFLLQLSYSFKVGIGFAYVSTLLRENKHVFFSQKKL